MKLQAAIDFLSSYGLAFIVMIMALIVFYIFVSSSANNPSVYCDPAPGFSCDYISVNSMGILTARFSQALGTQITINGVACSSNQNSTIVGPKYGNIHVSNSINYYPAPYNQQGHYPPGNTIYSGSYYVFYMYCYSSGGISRLPTGKPFQGYVWINFTIPNYGSEVQQIASFSTAYS